jgi:hypothetical protein
MRDKGLATAFATLLAAFATAHLMQFGLSAGRAITGDAQSSPIGLATLVAWRAGGAAVDLPPTPALVSDPVAVSFALPDAWNVPRDRTVPELPGAGREDSFGLSCARTLTLVPLSGALIEAQVKAACDPGVRVEMSHAGLRFAMAIGPDGNATALIPALMAKATVEAAFADGTVIAAEVDAPDAVDVERIVLVADGWAGLTLHAAETASWRGHLSLSSTLASLPRGGEIVRLGDPMVEAPLLADVYTAQVGRFGSLGGVTLRVEAVLSAANCARDVGAEVIRSSGGVRPLPTAVRLSLPACDDEGGVLVVDLPPPAFRLARN